MPKLTKKLATEILGEVKTIEAGRASGRFGTVSNQGDVPEGDPISLFELPENWRNVIAHASAFVGKDLETSLSKCSYVLDGSTLSAIGPYAAIKLPFAIELDNPDSSYVALPSEIGWQHLPGTGAAILAIYADTVCISQEVWSVTSARLAGMPPMLERAFKDEDGYQTIEIVNGPHFCDALDTGPTEITLEASRTINGVFLCEFGESSAWSKKQAIFPTTEGPQFFEPIAVDSSLLLNAVRAAGAGAILAVRGPLDAIQIFGLAGEHVVIMPLKPKAEGKAA